MTMPRRRLIRPDPVPTASRPLRQRQTQKLRERLEHERAALARWQSRMRRAFNAVAKCQKRISRIERQLTNLRHLGRTMTYEADLEKKIQALTPEKVQAALKKHVDPKKLVVVAAGDFEQKAADAVP